MMHASAIKGSAQGAVHEAAPWVARLARLGFVARAALYMTIGGLAVAEAAGKGGGATGQRGAMDAVEQKPAGAALLVVIAIGLFGYAIWRFIDAVLDPTRQGHDAKGVAKRIRSIGMGCVQAALGFAALKIVLGYRDAANDGQGSQDWMARTMSKPGGAIVLYIIAAGFVVSGLYQLYKAVRAKLDKQLQLGSMSSGVRRLVIGASRFGIAARGVVFATSGVLIAYSVHHRTPSKAGNVKASLVELLHFGRIPFAVTAVGLMAYGVYQLIEARYRRIEVHC